MFGLRSPRLSVVMPVFNEQDHVSKTVESILNQHFCDFEFIIIDDGSNDNTPNIIDGVEDPRIRILRQKNHGVAYSLNQGVKLARGEYIARIDGDDIAHQDRLSIQMDYMEKHLDIGMVGSYANIKDFSTDAVNTYNPPTDYKNIKIHMMRDNPMVHSTLMFRKSAYEKVGGYDPANRLYEDYDFCIRMAERYEISNLPIVLVTRNLLRDHLKKPYWRKHSKYELYAARLRYQRRALKVFSFHYTAPVFLLKTVLQVMLERTKNELKRLQQA